MYELASIFANNIAPILFVVAAGYLGGRYLRIESRSIGQLIFNIFSPALVFYSLYTTTVGGGELTILIVITAAFQFMMATVAYAVMRVEGAGKVERSSIMLSSFCLNAGNFGLSVATLAFGEDVLARAVVVYIANTMLNYTFGVFVASSGRNTPKRALMNVLRVPAVYATIAALIFRGFSLEVPPAIFQSVYVMKDAAIPAMLILLGLQLSHSARVQRWMFVSTGVLLKLFVGPLIGVALVLLFRLDSLATIAFLLQVSMPTAVITLILAKEYQLDETLTLNVITVSTLLSPFTLSLLIYVLKQTLAG